MTRLFIVFLGAILLVTTACNESKDEADADGPITNEEFRFAAQAVASSALLTSSDLPPGWTAEPGTPDPDVEGTPEGMSEECFDLWEGINEFDTVMPDASAFSDDLGNPATDETISSEVAIFRDPSLASTGEQVAENAYSTCSDAFEDAVVELTNADFAREGEAVRIGALEIAEARKLDVVDFSFVVVLAVTYEIEGQSIDATITTTYLRAGRVTGEYTHVSFDQASPDIAAQLLETFEGRIEEADIKLPD